MKIPALATLLALASLTSCYHFRSWRVSDGDPPEVLYERAGCAACHGADRWGTDQAPALQNLSKHWDVRGLAAYIAAPTEHRDERLQQLAVEYEAEMPGAGFLSQEQRESLAEWLLGAR